MSGERTAEVVTVPERFNGPPRSANGGYVCGLVAGLLGTSSAAVDLRAPPPLGRALAVQRDAGRVSLRDGDTVVAEGAPAAVVAAEPPRAIGVAEARAASAAYPWRERHAFPSCFVCGPRRERGDGLELYAGPLTDSRDLFACAWTPAPEWERDRRVRAEIVWAALDCPSAVPVMPADPRTAPPSVLARLTASLEHPVRAGSEHVIVAWKVAEEGRKRFSASAILDAEGAVLARAAALWIELRA